MGWLLSPPRALVALIALVGVALCSDALKASSPRSSNVQRSGPPQARPLVLLIHGWAGDHRLWGPVLRLLHGPAVAIDLPGHGADGRSVRDWTMQRFTESLEEARRSARAPCLVLVAHSNGAYMALDYWRRHRRHVGSMVLVEGAFTRPFSDPEQFRRQVRSFAEHWSLYQDRPFGLERAMSDTVRLVRQVAAEARLDTAVATAEMLLDERLWALTRIDVPVVFAFAESPAWTPSVREQLQRMAPFARFENLGPVSHYAQLDAPERVAGIIETTTSHARCDASRRPSAR